MSPPTIGGEHTRPAQLVLGRIPGMTSTLPAHGTQADQLPLIVIERLVIRNSDAQAVWEPAHEPAHGPTIGADEHVDVQEAIRDARQRQDSTGLLHRVEVDGETVWESA